VALLVSLQAAKAEKATRTPPHVSPPNNHAA